MQYTRAEMKAKAIEILKTLQVPKNLINDYEKSNIVPYFSHGVFGFELAVRDFLEKNKSEIFDRYGECYAISLDIVNGYPMLSFLCYSPHIEDSEYMLSVVDFLHYRVWAYVHNLKREEYSEYGSIIVTPTENGLVRVG